MLRHNFKKHKYGAVHTKANGYSFDSKLECRYYLWLVENQKSGKLLHFHRQPKFDTGGGTTYSADFLEFWANGDVIYTDCKGMETKEFIRAKKQVEALFPITIQVVKKI